MAWDSLSDIDKAWIAGIFEGEGSIGLWERYGTSKYARIAIYNNDVSMLEEIQRLVGGKIYERKMGVRNPNWKPSYTFNLNKHKEVERFINEILPFIRSEYKQEQILKTLGGDYHGLG